jgi:hypothetical protein
MEPTTAGALARRRLRLAARDSFSSGNSGAVGLDHGADHHSGSNDSPGLRARGQRHLARLCAGDGRNFSGRRCALRATRGIRLLPGSLYTYASMTLPPWLSATVAWSLLLAYVATGSSVIGGFYHYANLLLRDATGHVFSATVAIGCRHRRFDLDCLSRREDFRAADVVDRSRVGLGDRDRCRTRSLPSRLARRWTINFICTA